MALATTRPTKRSDSKRHQYCKRTPVGLTALIGTRIEFTLPGGSGAPEERIRAKVGKSHIRFSLRTADDALAEVRTAAVKLKLAALVEAQARQPATLSHKQIVAIAGLAHQRIIQDWEDNPPPLELLHELRDGLAAVQFLFERRIVSEDRIRSGYSPIVDHLLAEADANVDDATRAKIDDALRVQLSRTVDVLVMRAEGDYSPDPVAATLPEWVRAQAQPEADDVTLNWIWDTWHANALRHLTHAPSTIAEYNRAWKRFIGFMKTNDATAVKDHDVARFLEYLEDDLKLSGRTVKDVALPALKTLFKWAHEIKLRLDHNPAANVKMGKVFKNTREAYTLEGARNVLLAALATHPATPMEYPETTAAYRLAPWLCYFTGARIGEITQLRKDDVAYKDTPNDGRQLFVYITPDAGRVKGEKARWVPVHSQLIELGFAEYWQRSRGPYLFVRATDKKSGRSKSKALSNRVAKRIGSIHREENVAPNHGFRHLFINLCIEYDVDTDTRKRITGRAIKGVEEQVYVGKVYGRLHRELCKLPHVLLKGE